MFSFYSCLPDVAAPQAADPSLFGSAPFRAVTHCEPFRAATGYGWYLYPPLSFHVRWDGGSFSWMPEGTKRWLPLVNLPGRALVQLRDQSPPELGMLELPIFSALPEHGLLQVWSGLAAVSPPGWALLISGVTNLPRHPAFEVLEGIIETDWFHGPILTNLRFRKTDEIVTVEKRHPLFMARPVRRECYEPDLLKEMSVVGFESAESTSRMVVDSLAIRRPDRPGGYRSRVLEVRRASKLKETQCPS
jgi:hypothetical protein